MKTQIPEYYSIYWILYFPSQNLCVCVCFVSCLQVDHHHLHNVKRFAWKHWPANLVPEQQQQLE
jgi:hypothetical protein